MLRIAIAGIQGRMGQRIYSLAQKDQDLEVVYGLEAQGVLGTAGQVPVGSDFAPLSKADVVIDFTTPDSSGLLAVEVARRGKGLVIGTTGLTAAHQEKIDAASKKIPIVQSPNMSRGVNVLFKIAQEVAKALPDYGVEIIETHHVHKKDKPSGTALRLGELIQGANGRQPIIHSIREGEVVGDHRVVFSGPWERLELFHHAGSRDTLAAGALAAAKWVVGRPPGRYSMKDVLGL